MSNFIRLAKALDEVALDLFKRDVEDRQRGKLYSWNLRGNMLVDFAKALRKAEGTEVFGETTQSAQPTVEPTVEPTVPGWYWVKTPADCYPRYVGHDQITQYRYGFYSFAECEFAPCTGKPEGWAE